MEDKYIYLSSKVQYKFCISKSWDGCSSNNETGGGWQFDIMPVVVSIYTYYQSYKIHFAFPNISGTNLKIRQHIMTVALT